MFYSFPALNSALILVNGNTPCLSLLITIREKCKLFVVTDGAANKLHATPLIPDVIIGDLDSIDSATLSFYQTLVEIICAPDQYATDLEKALNLIESRGYKNVVVTGINGGRLDHTITNLHILFKYSSRLAIEFFDDNGYGFLLPCYSIPITFTHTLPLNSTVSLVSFDRAENISTTGLFYPLLNEALEWGSRDGQSNHSTAEQITIHFTAGSLFIFICPPHWLS